MFTVYCLTIAAFSAKKKKSSTYSRVIFSIKENGEFWGSLFALVSIYIKVLRIKKKQKQMEFTTFKAAESCPIYLQTIFGFPRHLVIQYVNWPQFHIFYCMRFGSLIQTYFCSTVQECLAHSKSSVKATSLYSSSWNDMGIQTFHKYLQSGSSLYRQLWVHRGIGGLKRIKQWGAKDLFICFQKWVARPSQGVDNTCRAAVLSGVHPPWIC